MADRKGARKLKKKKRKKSGKREKKEKWNEKELEEGKRVLGKEALGGGANTRGIQKSRECEEVLE